MSLILTPSVVSLLHDVSRYNVLSLSAQSVTYHACDGVKSLGVVLELIALW